MIALAAPWALVALPLPLLIWRAVPPFRRKGPALRFPFFQRIVHATGVSAHRGASVAARRKLQMAAAVAVWGLVVLSMARPERLGAPIEMTRAARDMILAIDISGSMDTRDFAGAAAEPLQRLAGVKQVVADFIDGRDGDRMALIVFGTRAFLQAPPTEDLDTIIALLAATEVGMAGPTTALGDTIGLAIRTFETSELDQRLLILLSDGSDTASRVGPVNAAEIAAKEGVEIHTIAVGDPDATGEDRVDVETLRAIASRTGGAFFFATDADALSEIYARIDDLSPREVETLSYRPRRSLAGWCMGAAAMIGLGTMAVLSLQRRRRRQDGARA